MLINPAHRLRPQIPRLPLCIIFMQRLGKVLGLYLALMWMNSAIADPDRILDSIEYLSENGTAVIKVNLTEFVTYTRHFPERRGATIEISIRLPNLTADDLQELVTTEVMLAPVSSTLPLVGVSFEGDDRNNPKVIVRFSDTVEFDVRRGNDRRSLLISLPKIRFRDFTEPSLSRRDRQLNLLADVPLPAEDPPAVNVAEVKQMLFDARVALEQDDFNEAIRLATEILNLPDHPFRKDAEELLIETRTQARNKAFERIGRAAPDISTRQPNIGVAEPSPGQVAAIDAERENRLRRQPQRDRPPPATTPAAAAPATRLPDRPPAPAPAPVSADAPSAAASVSGVDRNDRNRMNLGRLALDKGDYATAVRIFSALSTKAGPLQAQARQLLAQAQAQARSGNKPASAVPPPPAKTGVAARAQMLMNQAKIAMDRQQFRSAARLLSQVVALGATEFREEAQQMLTEAAEAATKKAERQPRPSVSRSSPATRGNSPPAATPPDTAAGDPAADAVAAFRGESPAAGSSNDAAELMQQGRAALRNNNPREAVRAFTAVLNLPQNPFLGEAQRLLQIANSEVQKQASGLRDPIIGDPSTLDDVVQLMEQGKLALREGEYNRAIVIFTKLTELPEHPHSKEAMELLGVARQRNGQIAHAKAVFDRFLEKYPEGEDAVRIQQRIADLVSSQLRPQQRLQRSAAGQDQTSDKLRSSTFGSFSQYYYAGVTDIDNLEDNRTDQSTLLTYLTVNNRLRNSRFDLRSFFYGTYNKDFLATEAEATNRIEISTLYVDFKDNQLGFSAKLGRQSSSTAGVLGRFDGLLLGYSATPRVHFNAVAGFPVDLSNKDSIDVGSVFVGGNIEIEDLIENLDVIPYINYQTVDGIADRFAVGEEVRFFNRRGNFFNLTDYDILHQQLNIFLLHGQLNLFETTAVHFNFDTRNSPLIFTKNALINQTDFTSIEEMLEVFDEEELRLLAADRTGRSTSATLGASHSFNEMFQLSSDVTFSSQQFSQNTLDTSPDLEPTEESVLFTTRLTMSGLFSDQDITILSVGLTSATNYSNTSLSLQNRSPIFGGWKIDSRVRVNFRSDLNGEERTSIRPSLKLSYNWKRRFNIEGEFGGEITTYGGETNNQDTTRTFGNIGYRWTF